MRNRAYIALILFILIFAYLGHRLISTEISLPATIFGWLLLTIPVALVLWMPLVYWRTDQPSRLARFTVWLSYLSMALLSFLLMGVILRDLLSAVLHFSPISFRYSPQETWILVSLSFLLMAIGAYQAFFGLTISRVNIPLHGIAPSMARDLDGLTIAQLSDIHIGPTIQARFLNKMITLTNALNPDIVAITGDSIDGEVAQLREYFSLLGELKGKIGRFYITGNHEYYWDPVGWVKEAQNLGLTPLINSHVVLKRGASLIAVAGVTDLHAGSMVEGMKSDPKKAIASAPNESYKILLAHQPGSALEAAELGFHLQLSGHTHAGQFIPWVWLIRFFHRFYRGLNRYKNLWIYVSRGTGHWGPPIRLGASPEITLLTLRMLPDSSSLR